MKKLLEKQTIQLLKIFLKMIINHLQKENNFNHSNNNKKKKKKN